MPSEVRRLNGRKRGDVGVRVPGPYRRQVPGASKETQSYKETSGRLLCISPAAECVEEWTCAWKRCMEGSGQSDNSSHAETI